jgi:hypothetical protein
MVVYSCNSSIWNIKKGEFEASLDYIARPCLKKTHFFPIPAFH